MRIMFKYLLPFLLLTACRPPADMFSAASTQTPLKVSSGVWEETSLPTLTPMPLPPSATTTRVPPSLTAAAVATPVPSPTGTSLSPTDTPPQATATTALTTTIALSPTVPIAPPVVASMEPVGTPCFVPPEDYSTLQIDTVWPSTISRRTEAMLRNAQALYGGRGSLMLLIQGSYEPGLDASFGTHDGGGAVDVWMVDPNNWNERLSDVEIEQIVLAMRQSGFAAWFRPANMLYEGMRPHIHAIAIGDADLSPAAWDQLYAPHGYFAGNNGLPEPEFAGPEPHGEPIVCPWMPEESDPQAQE